MKKAIFRRRRLVSWTIFLILFFLLPVDNIYATEVDLVVSEIMYDYPGGDSGHEWLEIFNGGLEAVDVLQGSGSDTWRFFDGTNHILNLQQGTTSIDVAQYFIIAQDAEQFLLDYPETTVSVFDTVMNLKNTSSSVALSFDGGETYQVEASYDSVWGASGNGFSLEKINLNQGSESSNWQESAAEGGTPGMTNSEATTTEDVAEDDGLDDAADDDTEEEQQEETSSGGSSTPVVYNHWQDKSSQNLCQTLQVATIQSG